MIEMFTAAASSIAPMISRRVIRISRGIARREITASPLVRCECRYTTCGITVAPTMPAAR